MTLRPIKISLFLSSIALILSGCGGSSVGNPDDIERRLSLLSSVTAVVSTNLFGSPGSSDIAVVDLSDDDFTAIEGNAQAPESDIVVRAFGSSFYRIGRFTINTITKFSIADPTTPIWEFSLSDGVVDNPNPYDIVFESETKAYVIFFGDNRVWIVNPSATVEEDFKIGEIDLSIYDEGDGFIEAIGGIIENGQLLVLLARLNNFSPSETAYVAVIDTATDQEINTQQSTEFNGIPLIIRNPQSITYDSEIGFVVQGVGDYFSAFTGGIEAIDQTDFSTTLILDDGDANNSPFGRINGYTMSSSTRGYFTSFTAFGESSLRKINPQTGAVESDVVAGLDGVDISSITTGPAGLLWVLIADEANPRLEVIDPATDLVIDTIETTLNPRTIAFTNQ